MGRLALTSETLSTAAAGTLEYDGGELYFTPAGTQRGLIPSAQYFRLNGNRAGANATGAQSFFGVGVTLSSNTIYKFESTIAMSKSAGTTSVTTGLLYGGTATLNSIHYFTQFKYNTAGFGSVPSTDSFSIFSQIATLSNIISGQTSAVQTFAMFTTGTVSIASGGTFIPQYQLSAAPGGAFTVQAGSDFLIYPVGTAGSNASIGEWA